MKNMMYIAALLGLGACGLSEDDFNEQNGDAYCQALVDCGSTQTCDTSTATGTGPSSPVTVPTNAESRTCTGDRLTDT